MTKYFTQFDESTQTIGTNLAGWTTRGTVAPNSYAPAYGTPAVKKRYCNFKCNNTNIPARNLISLDAIDSDANRANVELLGCFKKDDATVTDLTLTVRGVGASGAAPTEFYMARCELAGNIYISERTGAFTIATVATAAFTFSSGKSYFVRFRANSTSLKLRVWDAALGMAGEPTTWNLDTTDASFSSAGWVAIGGYGATGDLVAPWNFLAIATNGDTAVCPRTNTEYTAWLDSQNAIRCVLAEMSATGYDSGGSPYTKTVNVYLSNHGYTSQQQDTPSLRHYDNYIQEIPTFTREMSAALSGQATTGFGDLIISNPATTTLNTGVRDNWLRMRWNRNYLKLYLGDPSWPKHDFRLMIYGRLGMPSAPSQNTIKFPIADLSDFFNTPIQTAKFTTGEYVDQYKPKLFGVAYMVEPPKTDLTNLIYTVTDGYWADTGESVYDNGISLTTAAFSVTAVNTGTGEITLNAAHGMVNGYRLRWQFGTPPMAMTVGSPYYHVVGTTPGTDKLKLSLTYGGAAITGGAGTTGALCAGFGWRFDNATGELTLASANIGRITVLYPRYNADSSLLAMGSLYPAVLSAISLSANFIDTASLTALKSVETSDVTGQYGFYCDTQLHLASEVLGDMATRSVTWFGLTTDGLFQAGKISLPAATAVMSFSESDVVRNSLRLVDKVRAINFAETQVTYEPWYVTGGPLANAGVLSTPLSQQATQLRTFLGAATYTGAGTPLDNYPDQRDATVGKRIDLATVSNVIAANMRDKLKELFLIDLGIFEFTTRLSATQLNIGDTISLTHPRYEWKQYAGSDDASPDNTGTVEARYAVVIGIATDVAKGTTKIKCFRRIPGYYPTTDLN